MAAGKKRLRGVPALYSEMKKQVSVALTPSAIAGLDSLAADRKTSRSEFVELIARGVIPLAVPAATTGVEVPMVVADSKIAQANGSLAVSISERHLLPARPAIYLVLDQDEVLFIGWTENLQNKLKWLTDARLQKLEEERADAKIVWLECSDASLLPMLKKGLVKGLQPKLAGAPGRPKKAEALD